MLGEWSPPCLQSIYVDESQLSKHLTVILWEPTKQEASVE
jgi:hypothetical protein